MVRRRALDHAGRTGRQRSLTVTTSGLLRVADFLHDAAAQDVEPIVDRVGLLVLDFIGGAVAGATLPEVRAVAAAVGELDGAPSGAREVAADRRAFLWAVATNAVDAEDTHLDTMLHLEGVVGATLAAVSSLAPCDGTTLCRALAAAYDVGCGIAGAEHYDRGWHSSATIGALAATAGATIVLGLDRDRTADALAAVTSFASGVRAQFGSEMKAVQVGRAAGSATLAAVLARHGIAAQAAALDGPLGWPSLVGLDAVDAPARFGAAVAATALKPYPSGVVTHTAGEAALELHGAVDPAVVEDVVVSVSAFARDLAGTDHPSRGLAAKLSLTHTVTVALLDGRLGLSQFSDQRTVAQDVVTLRERVVVQVDASLPRFGAVVEVRSPVHVRAGRDAPLGSQERPLDREAILDKVRRLSAASTMTPDQLAQVEAGCLDLLSVPDVQELFRCLAP